MKYLINVFVLWCTCIYVNCLQCMDENNNPVDWYVLYKIPHIKKGAPNENIKNGFAYMYITSQNTEKWTLSNVNIMDAEKSFLATTLQPVFQGSDEIAHIFYNDEKPKGSNKLSRGHTKGVLVADKTSGFWLIHSVPLFPPKSSDNYSYPLSGTVYGQSVMCLSMNTNNINNVALQLLYDNPQVYSHTFPDDFLFYVPNMKSVIEHTRIDSPPWFKIQTLQTLAGQEFVSFAKTSDFSKDLYEDLVAPGLSSSLYVETWLNGPGKMSSNCSQKFSVKNIQEIVLNDVNITFSSSIDHSKWAVSADDDHWTCIGDINRAEHQKKRGGGTTCINNMKIANLYKAAIQATESCQQG